MQYERPSNKNKVALFLARCLTRFLGRILARFLARSVRVRAYFDQFCWDGEIRSTVLPGQRKRTIYYLQFEIAKIQNTISGTTPQYDKQCAHFAQRLDLS